MNKATLSKLSLLGLFGLGIMLRLWHLPQLFHFTYDEEVIAFVGKRMFVNHHIPLIGGVTPMHVHLAPYFYWLSGIFLYFSRLDPLGWGVVAAFLSGITMLLLYKTGAKFFGKRTAFIGVFIYSVSFFLNIFDRHYWGLAFDGMLSLAAVFCLYQIINKKEKFLYVLAGLLAFGFHTDPSTLTLFVLTVLVWVFYRPRISKKAFILSFFIFMLSFVPLVLFDVRHDFANSRGIMQYVDEIKAGRKGSIDQTITDVLLFVPRGMWRTLYVSGNTDLARQYSYCPQHLEGRLQDVPWWGSVSVLLMLVVAAWYAHKKSHSGLRMLVLLFIATYFGISIYGVIFHGDLFDHYLGTLFPLFILLVAFLANKFLKNNGLLFVVLSFFAVANIQLLATSHHRFGYQDKVAAVNWAIQAVAPNEFSLDVIGDCFRYNGYRYLFYVAGKEPVKSYVDANFTHLYDNPPAETYPPYLVVLTNPDWEENEQYATEYNHYKEKLIQRQKFGEIEVFIVDNKDLDFVGKF